MATATARFSSNTGDGSAPEQHVVEADDLGQSVAALVGASACTAAIAACSV